MIKEYLKKKDIFFGLVIICLLGVFQLILFELTGSDISFNQTLTSAILTFGNIWIVVIGMIAYKRYMRR